MYYTPLYADRVFIRRHVEPAPCNAPPSRPLVSIAIRTHPIKPSAERVPALMNPTTIPSAPLIPNNELYERMLPHSARRTAPRQISSGISTRWLRSITYYTIRYDTSTGTYLAHRLHHRRRKTKASRGEQWSTTEAPFDDNESRGYSNYPETRYDVRKINDRRVYYVTSRANVPRLYQC